MRPDLLIIVGPTASGKTSVGIEVAHELGGEIISADARQVYRWMDIGTAKPTGEERAAAPHHLIDFLDPAVTYSAGRFAEEAAREITAIQARGKFPIIVGGAGLYLRALLDGFSPLPEIPAEIRASLQKKAQENLPALFAVLQRVDPVWAKRISSSDRQRIVRGLEVWEATGRTLTEYQALPPERLGQWSAKWFGLHWDRQVLYNRIDARAEKMIQNGLVDEVRKLQELGYSRGLNALNTFGYREVFDFLDGDCTLDQALMDIQQGSRRYAKRQLTWFRQEPRVNWLDAHTGNVASAMVEKFEKP